MKIRIASQTDLRSIAKTYADASNSVRSDNWTIDSALDFLSYLFDLQPDLFFIALEDKTIVGGVAGIIRPWVNGQSLAEIELFVRPQYQGKKIGKKLLRKIIFEAKARYNINDVNFLADASRKYPFDWYGRIGMKPSNWIDLSGNPDELLRNL